MKAERLKANQTLLKQQYLANPASAVQRLQAIGKFDPANLACEIVHPTFLSPAGLHPASGGDGTFACSVEIMLAALVSCAAVTMAAVANSMNIPILQGTVKATGTMDFRGTLAVDRQTPVGLTELDLEFNLDTDASEEQLARLLQLAERYCVVYQSFVSMPIAKSRIVTSRIVTGQSAVVRTPAETDRR